MGQKKKTKKFKKHEQILSLLKQWRKANEIHSDMNDCLPSSFMEGCNRVYDDMIEYIEKNHIKK